MKLKYNLLALCLFSTSTLFAQTDSVDVMPEFKGSLNQYLGRNIRYPAEARIAGIEGKVIARFIITKTGGIDSITILKSPHPSFSLETARIINGMNGLWQPGYQNEAPVDVHYTLPITYSLGGPSADNHYNEGKIQYDKGKYSKALNNFLDAIKIDPNHDNALYYASLIYINEKNKPEKACPYLQRIKKNGTQNVNELLEKYCKEK